jgi:glycine/D-amino acid oxidase-like deaminating enzyme
MIVSTRPSAARIPARETLAPSLIGGARVDICIVGGGLAGMIAAYLLAREKRSVMLVDEGPLGGAPGGGEVAQLASMVEQPYCELERIHGPAAARIAAQGHAAAIDALEAIVHRERIACEFERLDGYRFPASGQTRAEAQREADAARRAGVHDAEVVSSAPIEGAESGACVRYPAQAQFHPLKFLLGLARAITREGGRVHCGVRTRSVAPGKPATITTTAGHRIEAQALVTPGGEPAARAAHVIGMRVPRGSVTRALYWDASGGLRSARLRSGNSSGELLLVAGEDDPEVLASWARGHFPRAGEVVQRFSAELPVTSDLFAVSGAECDSESTYVSTASWGSPMTRSVIAAMVIRDFLLGERAAWAEDDSPTRCYA